MNIKINKNQQILPCKDILSQLKHLAVYLFMPASLAMLVPLLTMLSTWQIFFLLKKDNMTPNTVNFPT